MILLLIMLAYYIIACFVAVCVEKIFGKELDEDSVVQYLIGIFWIISIPLMLIYYLGKFLCKNFRKLLNVN